MKQAVDQLYNERQIRLWVVYVDSFAGQGQSAGPKAQGVLSDLSNEDAILAIATKDRSYAFQVPSRRPE